MPSPYFDRLATAPGAVLLLIGAFYVFAGWYAARLFLVEIVLDASIAAIGGKPTDKAERLRLGWLLLGCVLVFASGVALVMQSSLAVLLFAAGLAQQLAHILALAPLVFDRDEPPSPAGRRKTINAAIGYAVMTALVAWAWWQGRLLPVAGDGAFSSAVTALACIGFAGWILWSTRMPKNAGEAEPDEQEVDAADYERDVDPDRLTSVTVVVEELSWPLLGEFDDGYSRYFPPEDLGLSDDLSAEMNAWQERFDSIGDAVWPEGETLDHFARAAEFAERLRAELRAAGRGGVAVSYHGPDGTALPLD